jgi:hypothetical protein
VAVAVLVAVAVAVAVGVWLTVTVAVRVAVAVTVAGDVGDGSEVGVEVRVAVAVKVATGPDNFVTWYRCGARSKVPSWYNFTVKSYSAAESFSMLSAKTELVLVVSKDAERTV